MLAAMRFLVAWLLFDAALGLRRASRVAIKATAAPDSSGRWTAKAAPGLFNQASLSMTLPGGGETNFDCRTSRSASIAADAGLEVMDGTNGVAQLTAVKQSSGFIAGSIVDPKSGMVHQFSGKDGGEFRFKSTPSADFPEELDPEGDTDYVVEKAVSLGNGTTAQSNVEIDVMVLWTQDAECKNAGLEAGCTVTSETHTRMLATVELAVAETNQGYANSQINVQIRLVHSYRSDYRETGFSGSLNDLRLDGDGRLDQVHAERIHYGADVVALLIDDPAFCGIARLGPSYSSMFSVTAWNCATGYYSFGHEIGHNLGCRHDLGTQNACGSSNYHYGWRDPAGDFRTVMAYNCKTTACDNIAVAGCTRVNWWSNPEVSFMGKTTGASNANNARQINDVASTVATYEPTGGRTTTTAVPTPAPPPGSWVLTGSGCTVDGECIQSNNYPLNYGNDEDCRVKLYGDIPLAVDGPFATESGFDILTVSGVSYAGTPPPNVADLDGVHSGAITWSSDGSITQTGWRICRTDG